MIDEIEEAFKEFCEAAKKVTEAELIKEDAYLKYRTVYDKYHGLEGEFVPGYGYGKPDGVR